MTRTALGTFQVTLTPVEPELAGQISRMDFVKTFAGDLVGTGRGLMLSGGDPATGTAGYVAMETVDAQLDGRGGAFALQQFGTMAEGATSLQYSIVPGSGRGGLNSISGELTLTIDDDGTHRYALEYQV